jgi:hypothetical protein
MLHQQNKRAEAEAEDRAVLRLREKVLGPEHPDTLMARSNLAAGLADEGKYAEAEAENRTLINLKEKVYGPTSLGTLLVRGNLAEVLELGLEHPDTLETCFNLAQCLRAENKTQEATDLAQRAAQGTRQILGADHPLTKKCEKLVGELRS